MKVVTVFRIITLVAFLAISAASAFGQLSLVYPAGGEIFYNTRDTSVTIVWTGVDDTTKIKVEYSSNSGLRWKTISDTATGFSVNWSLKNLEVGTFYRVRVSQVRLALGSDNIQYVGHGGPVFDAYWNPANTRVVSVSADCHIWDASVGGSVPLVTLPAARTAYNSVHWGADSSRIAVGNVDGKAFVFNTVSNGLQTTLNHNASVSKVEFDPTSEYLMTACDDDRARIFRLPATAAIGTYNPASTLLFATLSPDGFKTLVCGDEARVYARAGGLPLSFKNHVNGVIAGAWSADGEWVCTVGGDVTIRLWNSTTGVEQWVAKDPANREGVRSVAFSPDGLFVAVGMSDSTVTVWNVADGSLKHKLSGHQKTVGMVQFSPNSEMLATASDDYFSNVYDVASGKRIRSFQHSNVVFKVRWNSTGESILTTSRDGTARIWRILDVPLQSDTSGTFSISPPPAAFARFRTNGGVVQIGDEISVGFSLEGASQIDLARIDSIQFTVKYNASILHPLTATATVKSEYDSVTHKIVTYSAVKLPFQNGELMRATFRATLGSDTITSLRIVEAKQIGPGTGIQVETATSQILVQGVCRAGGGARLYDPSGRAFQATIVRSMEQGDVSIFLPESGPTTIQFFDVLGKLRYSYAPSAAQISSRVIEFSMPISELGICGFMVVRTSTQCKTVPFLMVQE